MFWSKEKPSQADEFTTTVSLTKAERRVRSLGTKELFDWADQAGSVIADNFSQARKITNDDPLPELLEAQQGIEALKVVIDELIRRLDRPLTGVID